MKTVLLAKDRPGLTQAIEYLRSVCSDVRVHVGVPGQPFPAHEFESSVDLTVSYMSAWIVPESALRMTELAAVNFHPGPPEYPGTGCTNFAIYDGAKEYGVTAHLMEPSVDTGKILLVSRFPVDPNDSVHSLTLKCYDELKRVFPRVIDGVIGRAQLPISPETWPRKPFTRREFLDLCKVTPDMGEDEIRRRVRATTFPGYPGAYIELAGLRFEHDGNLSNLIEP